jgi:hypothetical protein
MALFAYWLKHKAMTPSHKTGKKKSHDTLTYNQEENKAMTPSHITRKKIKP